MKPNDLPHFFAALLCAVSVALVIMLVLLICGGCVNPNTGSTTIIGEHMMLPEITDSGDNISLRIYENIKGARIWTAKDCRVSVTYANCYTNSYAGIVETRDSMTLAVEVEPLIVAGDETAAAETGKAEDGGDSETTVK